MRSNPVCYLFQLSWDILNWIFNVGFSGGISPFRKKITVVVTITFSSLGKFVLSCIIFNGFHQCFFNMWNYFLSNFLGKFSCLFSSSLSIQALWISSLKIYIIITRVGNHSMVLRVWSILWVWSICSHFQSPFSTLKVYY